MKICVIGCGWLGLPLAKQLVKAGHEVHGSTFSNERIKELKKAKINAFAFDLGQQTAIPKDATNSEILVITVPPIQRNEPTYFGNCIAELLNKFSDLQLVIFTSSTGIYPKASSTFHENFEFLENEKNTLFFAEQAIQNSTVKRKTILRLGGLFGDKRHPARHLAGRSNIENPFGVVNLIHQQDVIDCIIHCLKNDAANGIFNLVAPEHPWRKEYYTHLYRKFGLQPINFVISPTIERHIDTSKLTKSLGFTPRHSIYDVASILD